ncbi:DUF1428 domain-containing protein [Sphingomonas sp. KR1UV-12]|uniref:DUF1428 domain-containing protein n=1 Tax=Sphingomonas aurea TaxID=3063994 RepID=A0ABT9EKF6_9SPHN|nr:DUF1428 domain-containing protein [Sphingomonas sp. KR1UV-12]MDP1027411.1 DUF1428 domain-containing protein [Sphingomonas sp. KR1UV-12]
MTYISGFVTPVPTANRAAYIELCQKVGVLLKEYGALTMTEAWGVKLPDGKVTDFRRAVQATEDETVAFSWIVWPDRATADASEAKMMEDPRMHDLGMPFDGKRMIFGGFEPIYELEA